MQVTRNGVYSNGSDLCSTCVKDNDKCVFKKALKNYHGDNDMPLSLMLMDCPEYRRIENRNARISWYDFNELGERTGVHYRPVNHNSIVRFNTGETSSGT